METKNKTATLEALKLVKDAINNNKQDKIIAGENITINQDGKTINANLPILDNNEIDKIIISVKNNKEN